VLADELGMAEGLARDGCYKLPFGIDGGVGKLISASRTGVRLTRETTQRSSSAIGVPGGNAPLTISSSNRP